MKKVLAIILCAALLLTAAACSKKEESTEAPVTEVQTTAPATQPQTTLPETTQPPTTEAPTEPAPKIDPNAKAQDIWEAALLDLEEMLRTVEDEKAESRCFSFNGQALMAMTVGMSMGGQKMDIPMRLSAHALGEADTRKGARSFLEYEADLGSMNSLVSLIGMDAEALKGALEAYLDLNDKRAYFQLNAEEGWQYTELKESEGLLPEEYMPKIPQLEEFFEEYEMSVTKSHYRISGRLKAFKPDAVPGSLGETEETGLPDGLVEGLMENFPLEDMVLRAELVADEQKRLCGLSLTADPFVMDLSDIMSGLAVNLDKLEIHLNLNHDEGSYVLPEKIREEATPTDGLGSVAWAKEELVIRNQLLAENEKLSIRLKEVTTSPEIGWGVALMLETENKTKKPITLQIDDITVDGYYTDELAVLELPAESHGEEMVLIDALTLQKIGLKSLDEISFSLRAFDTGDYSGDSEHLKEVFVINPNGAREWEVPPRREKEGELVLFDDGKVKAVLLEVTEDKFFGPSAVCYLENHSGKELYFAFEDVKINGKGVDNLFWETGLKDGLCRYYEQSFSARALESADDLKTIEFSFAVYDALEWLGEPLSRMEFTFTVQ